MTIAGHTLRRERNQVDWHQVHQVHEKDPAEYGEGYGAEEITGAVECVPDAALYELNQHFDQVLKSARNASGHFAADGHEQAKEQQTQHYGDAHGIHMNRPEAHVGGFFF